MTLTVRLRVLLAVLFKGAWPIWLALAGLAFACTSGWLFSTALSQAIRYAGMILQLSGLFTVAFGLRKMRQLFGRPSLSAEISASFRRLGKMFNSGRSVTVKASAVSMSVASAEPRLVRGVKPEAPLEQRVLALEENLSTLWKEVDTKVQALRGGLGTVRKHTERETRERQAEDEKTARMMEEVAVGGLHLETVGLFWLIVGVVGTSIPDELANLLIRAAHLMLR